MMKMLTGVIFLFMNFSVYSQVDVTIQIVNAPPSHLSDKIFVAGSFNSWSPNNENYSFPSAQNGSTSITTKLAKGIYEYKFTRGDWSKGEATKTGKDIENRFVKIVHDTTISVSIAAWKDDFANSITPKKHTASAQVSVLDTAFFIPQLNATRRIWIYLPKGYANSSQRYPVIYMHDGQNLFDEFTAGFGEWCVDEFLDSLPSKKASLIIVGVDNGPKRMAEYNPYTFRNFGKGEGDSYVAFLAETLKGFVDAHYRTNPTRKYTIVAGSSMGGLISLYAALKYPNVYGGAGIFSPAFWTANGIASDVKKYAASLKCKLFFYAGAKESDEMIPDMQRIEKEIRTVNPHMPMLEMTDAEAKHNEAAWRHYFPFFYNFVMP